VVVLRAAPFLLVGYGAGWYLSFAMILVPLQSTLHKTAKAMTFSRAYGRLLRVIKTMPLATTAQAICHCAVYAPRRDEAVSLKISKRRAPVVFQTAPFLVAAKTSRYWVVTTLAVIGFYLYDRSD
jgi:hypothetical protein